MGVMDKQLSEVETRCLDAIGRDDPKTVETYFGPYLSYGRSTANSGFIKAYMLLYYFSLDMRRSFYFTLETVQPSELEDEGIRLVMRIERYVNIGAVEKLRRTIEDSPRREFDPLLRNILEQQRRSIELSVHEDMGEEANTDQRIGKNIIDAMFIGRHAASF